MKRTIIFLLAIIVVGGVLFFGSNNKQESPNDDSPLLVDTWATYSNSEYGFSIDHPSDWDVYVGDIFGTPVVTIYPKTDKGTLPYTHHSNETQVSVFPKGVPSEGVNVSATSSEIIDLGLGFDYLLSDGNHFASWFGAFSKVPKTWDSFGFIWASTKIGNFSQSCISIEGVERTLGGDDVCETLGKEPETLIYHGTTDSASRAVEVRMLQSFKFTK